eukprot:gene26649-32203_t
MFGFRITKKDSSSDAKSGTDDASLRERLIHTVLDDNKPGSEEAIMGRRNAMLRAMYAEFMGTTFFFLPIFAIIANNADMEAPAVVSRISGGMVAGLGLVCMIMCFSGLSGAIFNPAITFALWITGKLSNRKCILFMITQTLASVMCMCIIWATFPTVNISTWESMVVTPPPGASSWNVFFTEFICTFMLTYAAFAMAFEEAESAKANNMSLQAVEDSAGLVVFGSNPQSKMGFAPFAIGFVIFALSQYGGGSGPAMNPSRMFGPALFANKWDSWAFFLLGQFLGGAAAGLLVVHGPQSAERPPPPAPRSDRTSSLRASQNFSMMSNPLLNSTGGPNAV